MAKISGRFGGRPLRGMNPDQARRILSAESRGEAVDPDKSRQARKVAKDHYAGQADDARRERRHRRS